MTPDGDGQDSRNLGIRSRRRGIEQFGGGQRAARHVTTADDQGPAVDEERRGVFAARLLQVSDGRPRSGLLSRERRRDEQPEEDEQAGDRADRSPISTVSHATLRSGATDSSRTQT